MVNIRYVDPDAAAGGDGTTNALIGIHCAYKSLYIWQEARRGILSDTEECICESNGALHTADTTPVVISGWTTTPNYYIYIHPSATGRHNGVYNTSKYRLEVNLSVATDILYNAVPYVIIEGLQFKATGATVDSSVISIENDTWLSSCIIVGLPGNAYCVRGIFVTTSNDGITRIWNNIIYDFDTSGSGIRIHSDPIINTISIYIYNNTIHNCSTGISHAVDTATAIAKNNLIKSCPTPTYGIFIAGTDYNATDKSLMGYTVTDSMNIHDRLNQVFTFVNELSDNFHLASTDTGARNYGINLSTDPILAFSTDIDGETRPGESIWDIGADEYVPPIVTCPELMNTFKITIG